MSLTQEASDNPKLILLSLLNTYLYVNCNPDTSRQRNATVAKLSGLQSIGSLSVTSSNP